MSKRIVSVGLVCLMLIFAMWGGNQNLYTKTGKQMTLVKYDVEYTENLTNGTAQNFLKNTH